jgi:ribonuclease HII
MNYSEMNINQIKIYLKEKGLSLSKDELTIMGLDERSGVKKAYEQFCRLRSVTEKERNRLEKMQVYENKLRQKGLKLIAGVDEAGRGPLAGPVVASAVILPEINKIQGINDSKKLSPAKRESLYKEIIDHAICWSIGISSVEEIDEINILQASLLAMRRAINGLSQMPEYVLVDAVTIPEISIGQLPLIKGDQKSINIAAASILAKVTRDKMMLELDCKYPHYGFSLHKGYGTAEHIKAIKKYGPSPIHRKTFIKKF